MSILSCAVCACELDTQDVRRKYCSSRCKDKGKPSASGLTCRICGGPMQKSRTSGPQGEAAHNKCRSKGATSKAEYMRNWHEEFRAANGLSQSTAWRRKFQDEMGYWPTKGSADWISRTDRLALYERDGWICYLCGDELSLLTDSNSPKGLSLDHVFPRSLGGTHDPENLKTCCRECNVRKSNKMPEAVA